MADLDLAELEAADRIRSCDYGMVDEDDARLVAKAFLKLADEVRHASCSTRRPGRSGRQERRSDG